MTAVLSASRSTASGCAAGVAPAPAGTVPSFELAPLPQDGYKERCGRLDGGLAVRRIPDRGNRRTRRNGRCLPSQGRDPRPRGCAQVHRLRPGEHPRVPGALHRRVEDSGFPGSPERDPDLPGGRTRGRALSRDALCGRRRPAERAPARGSPRAGARGSDRLPDRGRARRCACRGPGASGRKARERSAHLRRPRVPHPTSDSPSASSPTPKRRRPVSLWARSTTWHPSRSEGNR